MNGTHTRFPPHSVGVANLATRWHEVPLAPPLGELLSEREAEGVRYDEWTCTYGFAAPTVGEALSLPPFPGAKHPWLHLWGSWQPEWAA